MPCRPSTSISRTLRPAVARASARAAATVVLPVPPLPVTTCSRTPSQSVSRDLTITRLYAPLKRIGQVDRSPADRLGPGRRAAAPARIVYRQIVTRLGVGVRDVFTGEEVFPMEVLGILLVILIVLVIGGAVVAGRSLKVVQQYEQALIFRFGKVLPGTRGPGLTVIRPIGDRMAKVNMQIVAMAVPAQEGITRDNVTVRVDAVVYFRVIDPIKATINVQNYMFAISQQAQTSLRSIIGQSDMDQLLSERDSVNRELRRILDEPTEGPWGVRVERVELKDVSLPENMKRSMSRQAEAERERRARIITADGEYQASKRLAAAANVMSRDPAALQLRLLQTVVEVAGEKNSTLVMPVPVELLRFFEKMTPAGPDAGLSASLADFGDAEAAKAGADVEARPLAAGPGAIPPVEPTAIPPVETISIPP